MRPTVVIAGIASVAALGAFGMAGTATSEPGVPAFGAMASELVIDDVWVDAERSFRKIDVDRNGEIDVDEYAAQAVVYAGLIRYSGAVMIDGRETIHVGLPRKASAALGAAERSAIDAVARADFYEITGSGPITARRWVALRLESFERADRNDDGQLTRNELDAFAMELARYDHRRERLI